MPRVVHDTAELRRLRPQLLASPALLGAPLPLRLATWTSPPLADIVPAFLLPSQNWIAEQLLKTMGAELEGEGSWAAGIEVHARFLAEGVGLDTTSFFLRDGSGLSHQNLLAPIAVIRLLEHARGSPWYAPFLAGMPRPGQEEGTLERRLLGLEHQVAAKTGTITHVNGLSGYVRTARGRELTFSILTNATGAPAAAVREAMDRIVREVAQW
jgi:serine-type D-Ala-D-Ala carboxypeptidase/endopeptidase (penicillin-binding protein 4)